MYIILLLAAILLLLLLLEAVVIPVRDLAYHLAAILLWLPEAAEQRLEALHLNEIPVMIWKQV